LKNILYDRQKSVAYAKQWAMGRNPHFYNFDKMGGDCTNFASQCILAGCDVMNYTKDVGWYYNSPNDRTASWSGVEYLYQFLVKNHAGAGPFGTETDAGGIQPGDLIQLGNKDRFYHTPVVVEVEKNAIYVAAHTYDVYLKPLSHYFFSRIRYLHIDGARAWK
jgi:hypothetical protein